MEIYNLEIRKLRDQIWEIEREKGRVPYPTLDGVKRKVLDTSLAKKYGWRPRIDLEEAILKTFNDLKKNFNKIR